MSPAKTYLIIYLIVASWLLPSNILGANGAMSAEEWEGKPQPRNEPTIEYHLICDMEFCLQQTSQNDLNTAELEPCSAPSLNRGCYTTMYSFDRERLIGRVAIELTEPVVLTSHVCTFFLQIRRSGEFETVCSGSINPLVFASFTFPGQLTTTVRIVILAPKINSSLTVLFKSEEIQLPSSTRIMLLGDSITSGRYAQDSLGYRKVLYEKLVQNGFSIDFVGGYGEVPYESHFQGGCKIYDFYPNNGIKAPQLEVTADLNNYRPNIIIIYLGANNLGDFPDLSVGPYGTPSQFNITPAGQMASLIKYLLNWHNGRHGSELQHIMVCLTSPIKYADSLVASYNIEIARAVRDYANGVITGNLEPVHMVDLYTRFFENPAFNNDRQTDYSLYMSTPLSPENRLHPNTAGHILIGETLFQAIKPLLSGVQPWFVDRSWETNTAGLDADFGTHGLAVADVNADGRLDLFTTRSTVDAALNRNFYLQSCTNKTFLEQTREIGLNDPVDSPSVLFLDLDNDGDLDLVQDNSLGHCRLYQNQGNLFSEITSRILPEVLNSINTSLLPFDADNDGDLDLYALNKKTSNELFINLGAGHYQREERGAADVKGLDVASISATAADYDNDGDTDIYIVKHGAPNSLYVNNGLGYFYEEASQRGIALNCLSNSAIWADLDNDADLDLIVSVTGTPEDISPRLHVFQNSGSGDFFDMSSELYISMNGYSPLVGDFNLDGDLDIITTNVCDSGAYFSNNGSWHFGLVKDTGAEVFSGDVRCSAVFDYDNDGDLDFYLTRADIFNVFKENRRANANHYLLVQAIGAGGNSSAFGTKIICYESGRSGDPTAILGSREISPGVGNTTQYPLIQHFGLGNRTLCDLVVHFTNKTTKTLARISADQLIVITSDLIKNVPLRLIIASGDSQRAEAGQLLPLPLTIQVVDSSRYPVSGIRVAFKVTSGNAVIFPLPELDNPATSDSLGYVHRRLLLSTQSGPVDIKAEFWMEGRKYEASFHALAIPGPAATIEETSGNRQMKACAGIPLPAPFVVTVRDIFANPVPGAAVIYRVRAGGGTLTPQDGMAFADSTGQAYATLTPGNSEQNQWVTASTPPLAGKEINFIATTTGALLSNSSLLQNYPNPFFNQTNIDYNMASAGPISLEVLNLLGETVAVLSTGFQQAGKYKAIWRGTNSVGQQAPSGIYILRLTMDGFSDSKKIIFLR